MSRSGAVLLSFLCTLLVASAELNINPIVGIFTQPTNSFEGDCGGNCLYLAASYVKYIESSGARVVPINYYASEDELDNAFAKLNGFLFPGGGATFPDSAQYIFDKTVEANKAGDFMPLWGTCMGFQWLLISASRDPDVLDPKDGEQMDAYNLSIPLEFTSSARSSKFFSKAPSDIYNILGKENVTMNNHHYGIWTDHFQSDDTLSSFFDMLSTNVDRNGDSFVSTIESFDYPIFGTQWHPEKNIFEWSEESDGVPSEAINHSPEAVLITQYSANFFVEQARKSSHFYDVPSEEDSALIYNYSPTKSSGGSFVQKYFFPNDF